MTNLSELFAAADDETLKKVADSHPMVSDTKKEELCARISERINAGEEHADFVSGVEVRRGRGTSRFVGFAAALALVLGGLGGGGLLLKNRMGAAPAAELEDSAEVETEAVTDAEELTEEEAAAIAEELILREQALMNFRTGADMEVDRTSPVYKNAWYGDKEHGREVKVKYYRVTDERYPSWADVQAEMRAVYTEDYAKHMLENCVDASKTDFYTPFFSDDTGWYARYDKADWNSGLKEWDDDITVSITPDGNIEAVASRYDVSTAFEGVDKLGSWEEQMNADPADFPRIVVDEHSHRTEKIFTIVNTDDGWRIDDIKPVYTDEEYIAEAPAKADSEDYEAAARELTDEYYRFIDKMCGQALDIDRSVTLEKEEADEAGIRYHNTYCLITDNEFPNAEAARERCFEIFSEDGKAAAEALVITPDEEWDYYSGSTFIDKGDCWYILEQFYDNSGVHTWSDDDEFTAELTSDGDIHVVRKTEYVCAKARYEETREFTLCMTDDGWRISNLYPVEQKIVNE